MFWTQKKKIPLTNLRILDDLKWSALPSLGNTVFYVLAMNDNWGFRSKNFELDFATMATSKMLDFSFRHFRSLDFISDFVRWPNDLWFKNKANEKKTPGFFGSSHGTYQNLKCFASVSARLLVKEGLVRLESRPPFTRRPFNQLVVISWHKLY